MSKLKNEFRPEMESPQEPQFIDQRPSQGKNRPKQAEDSQPEFEEPKAKRKFKIPGPEQVIEIKTLEKNSYYIGFILLLAFVYIGNSNFSAKTTWKTDKAEKRIRELNAKYITVKSEIMNLSKHSEVSKLVEADSLKELRNVPKLLVEDEE